MRPSDPATQKKTGGRSPQWYHTLLTRVAGNRRLTNVMLEGRDSVSEGNPTASGTCMAAVLVSRCVCKEESHRTFARVLGAPGGGVDVLPMYPQMQPPRTAHNRHLSTSEGPAQLVLGLLFMEARLSGASPSQFTRAAGSLLPSCSCRLASLILWLAVT